MLLSRNLQSLRSASFAPMYAFQVKQMFDGRLRRAEEGNMNSKINEIIQLYFETVSTDFALILNGPWGCGKSFYVQNELRGIIQSK